MKPKEREMQLLRDALRTIDACDPNMLLKIVEESGEANEREIAQIILEDYFGISLGE